VSDRLAARVALGLAFAGLAVLVLGAGWMVGLAKLPGVGIALAAAVLFSLGTVVTKRCPLALPPASSAAWQMGVGCLPLLLGAILLERPDPASFSARAGGCCWYGGDRAARAVLPRLVRGAPAAAGPRPRRRGRC
jgi:drug/metabolite transporter (DMT)-like permease